MRIIDADALIPMMKYATTDNEIGIFPIKIGFNVIEKVINDAPTIEPQQWIPVSSGKLPDDLQEVNITWVNHAPEQYYDFIKDKPSSGSAVYYKGSWYWYSSTCVDILAEYGRNEMDKIDDGIEVAAWMPLPMPYKGGAE